MLAKSFNDELLGSLSRRSDVVYQTYPLRYKRGVYDFLRISSAVIEPDDKVMLIAAGVHGDEVAGPLTLLRHHHEIIDRLHASGIKTIIYPLRNPSGFEAGVRYNIDGDKGSVGNNDFLRYTLQNGSITDDLGSAKEFSSWDWSSTPKFDAKLPIETALMHELLKKDPLGQIVACIDLHQDHITPDAPSAAYHYAFGDVKRYAKIVKQIHAVVPLLKQTAMGAGFHVVTDEKGHVATDDASTSAALMSDKNGFIVRHDGSLPDLFWRLGAKDAVTVETMGATPMDDAIKVNMIWINGLIDLIRE